MKKFLPAVFLLCAGLTLSATISAEWSSGLQGGGTVTVDPDTRRATITRDGVTTPLWDGVHRLQDGSAMIVNDGEVVTGTPADRPHRLPPPEPSDWEGMPIAGYSPCEKLVHRVCGLNNECLRAEDCDLGKQLLTMERDERVNARDGSRMTYTSGQCAKALHDDVNFSRCSHAVQKK